MTLQGVPWFVKDASHNSELARFLAYVAGSGGEGVIGPTDFKVTASGTPNLNVSIAPGGLVARNAFAGGDAQSYLVRNVGAQVQALDAQGSGSTRHDLIAILVEDPQYAGQPAPVSVPDGPYVRVAVYKNVGSTVKRLSEVAAGQTGFAIARVAFAASDSTITNADITDLRQMCQPRTYTVKKILSGVATASFPGSLAVAPAGASWAVDVPTWARRAVIEADWAGLKYTDTGSGGGNASGTARVGLGAQFSGSTQWSEDASGSNKPVTGSAMAAEDIDVSAVAGTTVNLVAQLAKTGGSNMTAQTVPGTTVKAAVTFYESVA